MQKKWIATFKQVLVGFFLVLQEFHFWRRARRESFKFEVLSHMGSNRSGANIADRRPQIERHSLGVCQNCLEEPFGMTI